MTFVTFWVAAEKIESRGGKRGGDKEGRQQRESQKREIQGQWSAFPSSYNCLQMLLEGEGTNWWGFDVEEGLRALRRIECERSKS